MLELSVAEAIKVVSPGRLVLTRNPASALTGAITGGESLESGEVATFGHAMRMHRDGNVSSQERRRKLLPLKMWRGSYLRVWVNPAYTEAQLDRLCDEAELRGGTRYDWIGTTIGQLLRAIPLVGRWLGRANVPWTNYCSEGECEIEKKVLPGFAGGHCQVSPQDIDDWCTANGWTCITFKLV